MLQKTMVILLMVLIFSPSLKVTDPYIYHPNAPTLAEYNQQRYLEYLGEPQDPIVISYVEYTDEEISLMARVVMSEASILDFDGKQAIAQTIINRVMSDKFPNSVEEVVYQENQYSTAYNGEVTEECYEAVRFAIKYKAFPMDMFYFRQDFYHPFAYPYMRMGDTYFSTEGEIK